MNEEEEMRMRGEGGRRGNAGEGREGLHDQPSSNQTNFSFPGSYIFPPLTAGDVCAWCVYDHSISFSSNSHQQIEMPRNSQGNSYSTPGGTNSNSSSSYHYSNSNGSYYYKNDNGSTYYNSGTGYSQYNSASGSTTKSYSSKK
jgi:hypothetical protein